MRPCKQREFIKPSKLVIKQLFGKSDRNETKRMLQEMIRFEAQRFASRWRFEVCDVSHPENVQPSVGQNNSDVPILKQNLFTWDKVNQNTVPDFYSRPHHFHYSEARLQPRRPWEQQENQSKPFKLPRKERILPQPLSQRNTNQQYFSTENWKPTTTIKSPKKLSSHAFSLSSILVVPALRASLPNTASTFSPNSKEETLPRCTNQTNQASTSSSTNVSQKISTNSIAELSRKRKLFSSSTREKQLKITGNTKRLTDKDIDVFWNRSVSVQTHDLNCTN